MTIIIIIRMLLPPAPFSSNRVLGMKMRADAEHEKMRLLWSWINTHQWPCAVWCFFVGYMRGMEPISIQFQKWRTYGNIMFHWINHFHPVFSIGNIILYRNMIFSFLSAKRLE